MQPKESFVLTEERIRTHMKDFYEDFDSIFRLGKSDMEIWKSFFDQYYTKDVLWVRSSSNTLQGNELAEHFANFIEGKRMSLVSIDNIQILGGGTTAVVVFTADQEFIYRTTNYVRHRAVLSTVLHVVVVDSSTEGLHNHGQERILIAHEHYSVGQPIPTDTND